MIKHCHFSRFDAGWKWRYKAYFLCKRFPYLINCTIILGRDGWSPRSLWWSTATEYYCLSQWFRRRNRAHVLKLSKCVLYRVVYQRNHGWNYYVTWSQRAYIHQWDSYLQKIGISKLPWIWQSSRFDPFAQCYTPTIFAAGKTCLFWTFCQGGTFKFFWINSR